jgi:hypothetical protein
VADAGLKAAVFSVGCGGFVSMAAKGLSEGKLKGERRQLNAEGAESTEKEKWSEKPCLTESGGFGGANIRNGSRVLANCQLFLFYYCIVIRMAGADSNWAGASCGIGRLWLGGDEFDTAVEMCGKVRKESVW